MSKETIKKNISKVFICLIFWFMVFFIINLIFMMIALTNEKKIPSTRNSVMWVQSDMRCLATAIETYYVDFAVYPAMQANYQLPPGLTTPHPYFKKKDYE